jgi:hypothetical protein
MGFYEERPPRHGHRTPAELAEDEILSALHGDFCGMPEAPEKPKPKGEIKGVAASSAALLPWADAHPLTGNIAEAVLRQSGQHSVSSQEPRAGTENQRSKREP